MGGAAQSASCLRRRLTWSVVVAGVMTLQRRLSGMERDLAAIQARISSLEGEASAIEDDHPEEAQLIRERVQQITHNWDQLTQMVGVAPAPVLLEADPR